MEDIKKAYEDDSIEVGQKLNEEYLEKHEYAKVIEEYEKKCKEVERLANVAGMKNVRELIKEKKWEELGNLIVKDVLENNYVLSEVDWLFIRMLFLAQLDGRIREFRSNESREERTIGYCDKQHKNRWNQNIKLDREDMHKVIGLFEDKIELIEEMDRKRIEIWEGRPYKGDEVIGHNEYGRVVKECEVLKRSYRKT